MPRTLWKCSTIVAAFQLHLAAATPSVTTTVAVTPSVRVLAERAGMDPARERARFTAEIIRRVYSPPPSRQQPTGVVVGAHEMLDPGTPVRVEVPLSADVWSQAIFRRQIPEDELLATILADRRASLIAYGLLGTDDETLAFYGEHRALLTYLHDHAPGAFAAYASNLHVRGGRLLLPGGEDAAPLWQRVLHVPATEPEAVLRALFLEPEARTAYLVDVLTSASPESRAFALGLWMDDVGLRQHRFQALHLAVRSAFHEWHVEELPFARPLNDLAMLLLRVRVASSGAPAPPAERIYWQQVWDASPTSEPSGLTSGPTHSRIDAAWLLGATDADLYARGDKLDQFAFAQRVFGPRPDGSSEASAAVVREMTSRRMLLFGLERMGIADPALYVAAQKQARALADGGAERFWSLAQFQGALAILARMQASGGIGQARTERVLRSLLAVPTSGGEFHGALAAWLRTELEPGLPDGGSFHERLVFGVSGGPTPGSPEVEWEGQRYRLDLAFAERRRIMSIEDRQGGPDMDLALALDALAQRVAHVTSAEQARGLVDEGQRLLADGGSQLLRGATPLMARGVPAQRDGREWLTRALDEADRGARAGDVRRITRAGESLVGLSDVTLGHALLSFVYAMHLGDPDGPALLAANVALRHDFGFSRRDGEGRARGPWAMPRQDFQPGVPWHVTGSLLGLDLGLAPLSLKRMSMESLATPPQLQSIEREAFAVDVALLAPRRLTDRDRDRIVAAIGRGRGRVRGLRANPSEFDKLEDELGLDGWRARSLRWMLQNEPGSVENQLSLAELLVLGAPDLVLDEWGANGLLPYGCLCTRFPPPRTWRIVSGRTQLAMLAASTVEMNLELAQRFAALSLPAALLSAVLSTAMQDFVDQVDTADPGDRASIVRWVQRLDRNALADYVAAAATLDGPLVSREAGDSGGR